MTMYVCMHAYMYDIVETVECMKYLNNDNIIYSCDTLQLTSNEMPALLLHRSFVCLLRGCPAPRIIRVVAIPKQMWN
jgi:hypothetical protein|eukprot:COSAG01_NODE_1877_length_8995_cov_64.650556_9_plen_77_part_00